MQNDKTEKQIKKDGEISSLKNMIKPWSGQPVTVQTFALRPNKHEAEMIGKINVIMKRYLG